MSNATSIETTIGGTAEKPAIILVHGAFSDGHVWGYVAGKLKAQDRISLR